MVIDKELLRDLDDSILGLQTDLFMLKLYIWGRETSAPGEVIADYIDRIHGDIHVRVGDIERLSRLLRHCLQPNAGTQSAAADGSGGGSRHT